MNLKTVLIVEDDESLKEIFSIYLDLEGYKILTAANGDIALKLLKTLPKNQLPNCIILDLMMPVMDGNDFLKTIKTESGLSKIPVIMCSASGNIEPSLQVVEVLDKPVRLDKLKEVIERSCRAVISS